MAILKVLASSALIVEIKGCLNASEKTYYKNKSFLDIKSVHNNEKYLTKRLY